jgi:8-oxo-dGTP pyrophosphatase MutT (NUDIX family)
MIAAEAPACILIDEFVARAGRGLRPEAPGLLEPQSNPKGDHELELDGAPVLLARTPKPAAVLVPVVLREGETMVLFTQRAPGLRDHSGQIAFPGGKLDAGETALDTALREAQEEIGLEPALVEPLGYLDAYLSSSNYLVMPVVGLVTPNFQLAPNPGEVAEVFEVPLGFLMDPDNHELHAREWKGRIRQYYAIPHGERYIWGVTAGIVRNLYERLYIA